MLFVERTDLGYRAQVVDGQGAEIRSYPPSTSRIAMERELIAHGHHPRDVVEAIEQADNNYVNGRNEHARYWRELQWRVNRAEASDRDVDAIAQALRIGQGRASFLLRLLAVAQARKHETLIASFLDHENDDSQAATAMRVLIDLGFEEKYHDILIEWMRQLSPAERHGLRGRAIAEAGPAYLANPNPEILRALIDGVEDPNVTPGLRGTSVIALATALGIEWHGRDDDRHFVSTLLESARHVLAKP